MQKYVLSMVILGTFGLSACQTTPMTAQAATSHLQPAAQRGEAQARLNQIDFQKIKQTQQRPVVALVLGSGGARGYAHIGALEVLEQAGIQPDFIVGTSAGSIVGSIYASGKPAIELRNIAISMRPNNARDIKLARKGFFDGKKVEDYVNLQVNQTPLEAMNIPMFVVATALQVCKKVVFHIGNTDLAVQATVPIYIITVLHILHGHA